MEEEGFEPSKHYAASLQLASFNHLDTLLQRMTRIELVPLVPQTNILPLNYIRNIILLKN